MRQHRNRNEIFMTYGLEENFIHVELIGFNTSTKWKATNFQNKFWKTCMLRPKWINLWSDFIIC